MTQLQRISRNNTTIIDEPGRREVWLYGSCILQILGNAARIDNCGFNTVTTQTRLNQAFNQWGLPLYYSRSGDGSLTHNGKPVTPDPNGAYRVAL